MSDPNRNECSYSEKPNSSDTISRQAAIDALMHNQDVYSHNFYDDPIDKYTAAIIAADIDSLVNLPSAEPERPKGKWIPHIEKSREYIGTVLINVEYDYWFCDTCGYRVKNGQPTYNFCPNCGADMRKREGDNV
jgi:hypothetical protein